MAQIERQKAAKEFAEFWAGKGDEKQESQRFWIGLLHNVLGVAVAENYIEFEKRVQLSHTSYIDAYIADTKVLIEQKSAKIDLRKSYEQSDGSALTPFEQAKRYVGEMKASEKPRWIVVCNFQEFLVYDLEEPNGEPEQILLKDLPRDYYRLQFLVDQKNENIRREEEISIQAGKLVGKLYDAILPEYIRQTDASLSGQNREANMSLSSQDRDTNMSLSGQDRDTNMSLSGLTRQSIEQNDSLVKRGNDTDNGLSAEQARSLNILCVRIVFCLYAEDAGLFETRTSFEDYIKGFNLPNLRTGIINLFKALDTKNEDRDKYDETLKPFPYVNGGLFKDEQIEIPNFTQKIVDVIVNECAPFNWSEISPTIFGAVFESTLNPETRRKGGMHYTSIANIHKVIDPLFMDDLNAEFEEICGDLSLSDLTRQSADQKDSRGKHGNDTNCKRKSLSPKERTVALHAFQQKLGALDALLEEGDPAVLSAAGLAKARIQEAKGDFAGARATYEELVASASDYPTLAQAESQLVYLDGLEAATAPAAEPAPAEAVEAPVVEETPAPAVEEPAPEAPAEAVEAPALVVEEPAPEAVEEVSAPEKPAQKAKAEKAAKKAPKKASKKAKAAAEPASEAEAATPAAE